MCVREFFREKWGETALTSSPLIGLIRAEAPGSFSMRCAFHLPLDGGAQLKAYQFVSKSTPIKVVTSNKTIIIATRLRH